MTTRTRQSTVNFRRSFALSGLDERMPAGSYKVDIDEEAIDGLSFQAFRRTQTLLLTPALNAEGGTPRGPAQMFVIDGDELAAALAADGLEAPAIKEL
jgi:hypothetical protein